MSCVQQEETVLKGVTYLRRVLRLTEHEVAKEGVRTSVADAETLDASYVLKV